MILRFTATDANSRNTGATSVQVPSLFFTCHTHTWYDSSFIHLITRRSSTTAPNSRRNATISSFEKTILTSFITEKINIQPIIKPFRQQPSTFTTCQHPSSLSVPDTYPASIPFLVILQPHPNKIMQLIRTPALSPNHRPPPSSRYPNFTSSLSTTRSTFPFTRCFISQAL